MLTQEDDWFHVYWERFDEPALQVNDMNLIA